MMHKARRSTEEEPYCFSRSSIKFEGHTDRKFDDLNPILSKITRLVAAIKSLRFALFVKETSFAALFSLSGFNRTNSRWKMCHLAFCSSTLPQSGFRSKSVSMARPGPCLTLKTTIYQKKSASCMKSPR